MLKISLPKMLNSYKQVILYKWLKGVGEQIEQDSVICVVQSGQELFEVKSNASGFLLEVLIGSGLVFDGAMPIAILGDKGQDISSVIDKLETKPAGDGPKPQQKMELKQSTPSSDNKKTSKSGDRSMNQNNESAVPDGPVVPILMPQAGQSMEEGTILSWKVKEGDRIEVGQVIMEIETDKATMEVEAVDAGRVAKIVSQEGDIVEVKVPVAYLAEEGIDIDASLTSAGTASTETTESAANAPAAPKNAAAAQNAPRSVSQSGRVKASPAARKAAKDEGIDLASIATGSGPGGRIISTDVKSADRVPTETPVHALTKMRRAIANNLLYSKQNVPHFYAKVTIDAGLLFSTYRKTKEQFKCSVNDFVTRACAKAVRQYSAFRSQYKDTEIIENPSVNIGIAVGTDDGLTVPVVLDADRMNLEQLSARTRQVVEQARNGKLEGMGRGVFTITNLGMFGVEEFAAIINPPESAILAVGAIREGVAVENGAMRPTRLMTVTVSVDHRVVDGVVAAQFLKTLKELLENPEQLVS